MIAVLIGLSGGFIVGLTSVGSGTFFGLVMLIVFPLTAAKIVGTDIFHAAALLWVAGFGHMVAGNVDLHATGWLLIGSIPGVLLGSQVTVRLPDRSLRVALALTLTLAGVKLVELPGAEIVILVALSVAALLLLAAGVRKLLEVPPGRRRRWRQRARLPVARELVATWTARSPTERGEDRN